MDAVHQHVAKRKHLARELFRNHWKPSAVLDFVNCYKLLVPGDDLVLGSRMKTYVGIDSPNRA